MWHKKISLPVLMVLSLAATLLGACNNDTDRLTFDRLISQADKYNGKTVTLDAFYFTGFEIAALAGAVGPSTSGPWRIVPTGTLIWVKSGAPQDVYNRMYIQTDTPSGYAEHVGKIRVTGTFETGSKFGHLDAYQYQFSISSAELLDWSPPPAAMNKELAAETTSPATNPGFDLTDARRAAEEFIRNSSTFKFDGIKGTLSFSGDEPSPISSFRSWYFSFKFETAHPGHGDRSGQMLAQVITAHYARVLVNLDNNKVVGATCDGTWNMLKETVLGVYISGIVIGGGDTTPPGLMDAPRVFVYLVMRAEGLINVTYTAYPPSPVGDKLDGKITLDFEGGSVRVGDKMVAYGTLDRNTNTLVVAGEDGYIRTYGVKADVVGIVVGIKPGAAAGECSYELLRNDSTFINVRYTPGKGAAVSLYGTAVKTGDYLRAVGTYDRAANTIIIATPDDMIKSYDYNPVVHEAVLG